VIGRLSPEKDHERLLRVLSCLNRLPTTRDWKCLIFGSGALEAALREEAGHLGLGKRILWMGYRQDVMNELSGLDLLLSFSKAEGLPINLIEAGWAGTPVMATRVGGVTDLIPDESYGHLMDPGEPDEVSALNLLRALTPEGHAELENQAGRFQERVALEFRQSKWLQRLAAIYAEIGVTLEGGDRSELDRHSPQHLAGNPSKRPLTSMGPLPVAAGDDVFGKPSRIALLLILGVLSQAAPVRAGIPPSPVFLLTSQDNGTLAQTTFPCSGPIHGYVTLPQESSGKHVLEGVWVGPKGTVVRHSRDELTFSDSGSRTAEVWLRFTKEGGHLWNPVSVQAPGDEDRQLYDGPWKLEVRWDDRTIVRSDFTIQCRDF
jgi:hypothetical protein